MRKNLLSISLLTVSLLSFAQVGINTTTPNSTLDVVKSTITPTSAKDGITPPKVSKQELASKLAGTYAADQTGAIVYVSNVTTPTGPIPSNGQVINIDRVGFYYFDGSALAWRYLDTNTNPGNIYLNDGTLTSNRTLNQTTRKLVYTDTFPSPESSNISEMMSTANNSITLGASSDADTNPSMVINPVNRRVGLNVDKPKATLEINPPLYSSNNIEDGIIIPRLAKNEIHGKMSDSSNPYTTAVVTNSSEFRNSHVGTLLYIFNCAESISSLHASLVNATTDGFYYLEANRVWQKLITSANTNTLIAAAAADTSKDAWVNNSTNTRVELGTSSAGATRTVGTEVVVTDSGNTGMGTTSPTNKLHVEASSNPVKIVGLSDGTFSDNLVGINSAGEFKKIQSLNTLGMPTPAIFRLEEDKSSFLENISAGNSTAILMKLVKNAIPNLTYNSSTGTITIPAGTYQISVIYEAEHNQTGCTLSSYIVDFPFGNSGTTRIHSTASHSSGNLSNHGGTISYSTTTTATRTWTIHLGRGQSGNCSGAGMVLKANSTHLVVLRMGS